MVNFTKFSSLIIILLFLPIQFNIISLNSNTYSKVIEVSDANILPILKEDGLYASVAIFTQWNVTNIDWGNFNRNGNVLFVNVKIDFGERVYSEFEFKTIKLIHEYKIGDIDIGEYSLELYINDYKFKVTNFTINPSPIPYEEFKESYEEWKNDFMKIEHYWNGKEWIVKASLLLNFAPQEIDWGEVRRVSKEVALKDYKIIIYIREINITLNGKWLKVKDESVWYPYEHNYTLGLLPKGQNSIFITINNFQEFNLSYNLDTEFYIKTITKRWTTTSTHVIEEKGETITLALPYVESTEETIVSTITMFATEEIFKVIPETITTTSILEETPIETTSIIEETKTTMLETETKTIKTFEETKKEEIEQFTIPIFLFIIVIMITFLLYYILFKRRRI
ncbi:MAG: hypothetical protein QW806_09880 [Nitrososphaerota archaeon]